MKAQFAKSPHCRILNLPCQTGEIGVSVCLYFRYRNIFSHAYHLTDRWDITCNQKNASLPSHSLTFPCSLALSLSPHLQYPITVPCTHRTRPHSSPRSPSSAHFLQAIIHWTEANILLPYLSSNCLWYRTEKWEKNWMELKNQDICKKRASTLSGFTVEALDVSQKSQAHHVLLKEVIFFLQVITGLVVPSSLWLDEYQYWKKPFLLKKHIPPPPPPAATKGLT